MAARAKSVVVVMAIGALFVFAALASPGTANAAPKKKEEDDESPPLPPDAKPQSDVSVTMPGADGTPGTGPELAIDEDLLADDEPKWEVPGNALLQVTAQPDNGVTAAALQAQIENKVPDVSNARVSGKYVVFEVADDETVPITIHAGDLHSRFDVPAIIVDVQTLPAKNAPAPAPAKVQKPAAKKDAELVEEVLADTPATREQTKAAEKVAKEVTGGQKPTPLAVVETSKEMDPHGTNALARLLLARENLPNWKDDLMDDVKEWQKEIGFPAADQDGKFGLDSVAKMAEEVGILPLVRFYPKTVKTKAEGSRLYGRKIRAVVLRLQNELPLSEQHIFALNASMKHEQQQSMGVANPAPQKTLAWVASVNKQIGDMAEDKADKELAES